MVKSIIQNVLDYLSSFLLQVQNYYATTGGTPHYEPNFINSMAKFCVSTENR